MSADRVQRRVWVSGRVQGVNFRNSTGRKVREIDAAFGPPPLCGQVRNLPDGRVELVVAGPETAVLELVAWCRRGPPAALVERLEVVEEEVDPRLSAFQVLRGAQPE